MDSRYSRLKGLQASLGLPNQGLKSWCECGPIGFKDSTKHQYEIYNRSLADTKRINAQIHTIKAGVRSLESRIWYLGRP